MSNLQDDLRKNIEKHLPKQVGEVLQKRLNELESFERWYKEKVEEVKMLNESINHFSKENKELQKQVEGIKILEDAYNNGIKNVEATQKSIDLLKVACDLEIKHSNEKVDLMKEIFAIPFQNRIIREDTLKPIKTKNITHQEIYNSKTGNYEVHPDSQENITLENETKKTEEG